MNKKSAIQLCIGLISSVLFILKSSYGLGNEALDTLIHKAKQRIIYGNALDSIAITELPGYTGWNRDRLVSKVDQCFGTRIGNQTVSLAGSLSIFHHNISKHSNHPWTVHIACPNVTVAAEEGHLPIPSFYARAYGPAILVGYQNNTTLDHTVNYNTIGGLTYSTTEISFFFIDPGLYTIEIVLESLRSPNVYRLPHAPLLNYEGFLLPSFPLILNVTRTDMITCNTAQTCNLTLCTTKDIESDFSSSSSRWIVLGHTSRHTDKVMVQDESMYDPLIRKYTDGTNRLSIETDYQPMNCVLAPLRPAIALLDTCVGDTGIFYIFIGDSVTRQHKIALSMLMNDNDRVILVQLHRK